MCSNLTRKPSGYSLAAEANPPSAIGFTLPHVHHKTGRHTKESVTLELWVLYFHGEVKYKKWSCRQSKMHCCGHCVVPRVKDWHNSLGRLMEKLLQSFLTSDIFGGE